MKKVSLFMIAAFVAVSAGLVSCGEETLTDPPLITVNLNGTDQTEVTVTEGTSVTIRVDYDVPGEIKQIDFDEVGGSNLEGYPMTKGFTSDTKHQANISVATEEPGTIEFTTKVTDKEDRAVNKTIKITVEAAVTALEAGEDFTLTYVSASQIPEHTITGVKFAAITDAVTARISVIATDGKFVTLTKAEYDAITSKELLKAAYDDNVAGTKGVANFTVQADARFTAQYFISKVGEEYFLINMTALTFKPGDNQAKFSYKK